jgi:putative transposase
MSTTYPSDLTDAEWAWVQRHFPPLSTRGRPRTHALRRILDAIFYIVRSGCAWRYLPANFPPWQTVFYHFRRFRLTGKWHLLVDTLGLPIISYVTPVDVHDTLGARKLLGGLAYCAPRLKRIWANAAYRGKELADWCQQRGGWELEIIEREPGAHGFSVQPRRWVVERSFAWLSRNRRLAKDYERKVQTSETLIEVASMRLVLRRLARPVR